MTEIMIFLKRKGRADRVAVAVLSRAECGVKRDDCCVYVYRTLDDCCICEMCFATWEGGVVWCGVVERKGKRKKGEGRWK